MRGDSRRLSAIPGVGKKTSERICLELRDKLIAPPGEGPRPQAPPVSPEDDAVSALINLGYKAAAAEPAVRSARQQLGADPDLSSLIRAALKLLTK